MPNLVTESDEDDGEELQMRLKKSFRQAAATGYMGWVCNSCGALTITDRDAETHLAWHQAEAIGG